jgi:hypothetical protein
MEPDHAEWKRRVLSGELDLAEIDTAPYDAVGLQSTKWKPGMAVPTHGG